LAVAGLALSAAIWPGGAGGLIATESLTLMVGDVNDAPVAGEDATMVHVEASTADSETTLLWDDDFSGDWTDRWPMKWVGSGIDERTSTFEKDGETWLRVVYPEGKVGTGLKLRTTHTDHDRVYLEYKVRFAEDFDWVKGGKLPGLYAGHVSAGTTPDGENGFGVRFMWKADGKGSAYVYHMDMPGKWGEHFRFDDFWFEKGVVQALGLELVANTPGKSDGIIRAWLDGVLVVEETGLRFREIPDLKIEGLNFGSIFGGNDDSWAPTKDEHIDFGDFKFYTAPP
jgi:hypothetical protein